MHLNFAVIPEYFGFLSKQSSTSISALVLDQCDYIMLFPTFSVVLGVQMSPDFGGCRSVVFMSFLGIYGVFVSFFKMTF